MRKVLATVNTDASYSHACGIGTYAFWITTPYHRYKKSGVLSGQVKSSLHAEVKAIGNAVWFLVNRAPERHFLKKIIVNTDCQGAIHLLTKGMADADHKYAELRNEVFSYLAYLEGVKHELRHVKAHTDKDNARSYVNRWCDQMAKKRMGEYLKSQTEE